jgi:acyl-CoA reductase-like NAD-dependent aldehyde dehydrogenase
MTILVIAVSRSFTRYVEIGCQVIKDVAACNLKSISVKLGDKSPLIIFNDVL